MLTSFFSDGLGDEACDDVLCRAASLEDGALPLGASLAIRYLQHAAELGLAAEVLRDGTEPAYQVSGELPGGGAAPSREFVEAGV